MEQALPRRSGRPPVERWHPPLSGDIDIRIDRRGDWYHEGGLIRRRALVELFASILRREADGCHYLVTPVEKWRIQVEDAALLAVDVDRVEQADASRLLFTLNDGERVSPGLRHPLQVLTDPETGEPRPYLTLDRGLSARLLRPVFYRLVEWGEEREGVWQINSDGHWFVLGDTA